jgi:hypothetical protein
MEWKPIETALKDGTDILTSTKEGSCSVRYWGENDDGDEVWLPRIRGEFPEFWMRNVKKLAINCCILITLCLNIDIINK